MEPGWKVYIFMLIPLLVVLGLAVWKDKTFWK